MRITICRIILLYATVKEIVNLFYMNRVCELHGHLNICVVGVKVSASVFNNINNLQPYNNQRNCEFFHMIGVY